MFSGKPKFCLFSLRRLKRDSTVSSRVGLCSVAPCWPLPYLHVNNTGQLRIDLQCRLLYTVYTAVFNSFSKRVILNQNYLQMSLLCPSSSFDSNTDCLSRSSAGFTTHIQYPMIIHLKHLTIFVIEPKDFSVPLSCFRAFASSFMTLTISGFEYLSL